ncbi:MAG: hypothetical protein ACO3XO_05135 [Bdellovibrionota bacterium]
MFDDSRSRDNARGEGATGGLPPLLPEKLLPVTWTDPTAAYTSLLQGLGDGSLTSVHLIDSLRQVAIQSKSGAFIKYDTPADFFEELKGAMLYPFQKQGQLVTQAALPIILDDHQIYEVQCRFKETEHRGWKIHTLTGPPRAKSDISITTASRDPEEFLQQVAQLLERSSESHLREASISLVQSGETPVIEIGELVNKQQMEESIRHIEQRLQPVHLIPYPINFDFKSDPNERIDGLLEYDGPWIVFVKYGNPMSGNGLSLEEE